MELPGSLTRDQLRGDRRQANAQFENASAARDLRLGRVTAHYQRLFREAGRLDLGAFVQDLRMEHPTPVFDLESSRQDAGVSARHVIESGANRFTWGTLAVMGGSGRRTATTTAASARGRAPWNCLRTTTTPSPTPPP
ncbi:hypothetical protein [Aquisalimonas sp.]|uniref:hypothetical protein n=1 Tax=Aquisalimonas sp. TaxID=1872621 RepID=UPI0025BF7FF5|nr:hypothetical protein [Aquisalimonas sp.]